MCECIMDAALRQPVTQYVRTISNEKWDSLHTIDDLDTALKRIIHNHFPAFHELLFD